VANDGRPTVVVTVRHGARIPPCHSHTLPPLLVKCVAISKRATAQGIRVGLNTGGNSWGKGGNQGEKELGGQQQEPAINGRKRGLVRSRRGSATANFLTETVEKAKEAEEGECIRMGEQEKEDNKNASLGTTQEVATVKMAAPFCMTHQEELIRILHKVLTLSVSHSRRNKSHS
jgi:hypothetical protein